MPDVIGSRRALGIGLLVVAATLSIASGLVYWALDPGSLMRRLAVEVERSTGRKLTIAGKTGVKLAMVPTFTMEDVALSNPPGYGRPNFATAARVEVSLVLASLLDQRVIIDRITLVKPEIQLETNAAGKGNWIVTRPPAAASGTTAVPGEVSRGGEVEVQVNTVELQDGRISWLDGVTGQQFMVDVPRITGTAGETGPMRLEGNAVYRGRSVAVTAQIGTRDQRRTTSEAVPFPVGVNLDADGAVVKLDGQISRPLEGRGYSLAIDGRVPNPSAFAAWFPDLPLKAFKGVTTRFELSDRDSKKPVISQIDIRIDAIDLEQQARGVSLENVSVSGRGDAKLRVASRVLAAGIETSLNGTIGDLPWLAQGATGPVDVDLEWAGASARGKIVGRVETPASRSGFGFDLNVDVPDPSLLSDAAPPSLKAVSLRARLTDTAGPMPFRVTSSAGDLEGNLAVAWRPRLSVVGEVRSERLDIDALRSKPVTPARDTGPTKDPGTARDEAKAARLLPGDPLPFEFIRSTDADIKMALNRVKLGGADLAGTDVVLSMKDGLLRLDPFKMSGPDQNIQGSLTVDARRSPAVVGLRLQSPGTALRPLLSAFALPPFATGTAEMRIDLTAAGDSWRALAATLDGWTGFAVKGGQLDARLINQWLEQLRPLRIEGVDSTELRCFAVRGDMKSGRVTIQPLAFNTAALILEGSGEIDLARESLALKLRPRTRIGGTSVSVPVRIDGTLIAPKTTLDLSPGGANGGTLAGLVLGGKEVMSASDPCPAALVRARDVNAPADLGGTAGPSAGSGTAGSGAAGSGTAGSGTAGSGTAGGANALDILRLLLPMPGGKK